MKNIDYHKRCNMITQLQQSIPGNFTLMDTCLGTLQHWTRAWELYRNGYIPGNVIEMDTCLGTLQHWTRAWELYRNGYMPGNFTGMVTYLGT